MSKAADDKRKQREKHADGQLYLDLGWFPGVPLEVWLQETGLLPPLAETTNEDIRTALRLALILLVAGDNDPEDDVQ